MTHTDVSLRPHPRTRPTADTAPPPGYPRDRLVAELFTAQAAARPDALAARHGERTLTYGRLDARSDALAARLRSHGVEPGDLVGVCGGRSLEALVALLGILKAGCAYVPLDQDLPPARLRAMAEDAGLRAAVTLPGGERPVRGLRVTIGLDEDDATTAAPVGPRAPSRTAAPTDPAYVAFTSGTTGRPKPVAIPHRGVVRLVLSDPELPPPGPDDRVLHAYGLSSDASTIEIWGALLTGACLVIADRAELLSPTALEELLRTRRVTVAYLTTSVFHLLARTRPEALAGLRFVSAGGEAMDPRLANAVLAACPGTTVVNFYGPTENAVVSTAHVLRPLPDDAGHVPLGRPFGASTCHVVRPDGTPAAPGEEGELYVGGDGLALGYLGDAALTAERFVTLPAVEPGGRLYRTGDRAVLTADGLLEYHGRLDRQVKLRGVRVELDEVEARLRANPAVGEAVVEAEDGALTAYVTPAEAGHPVPVPDLRAYCAQWLPAQAVPALVPLERFPVTSGGKVDRARLKAAAPAPEPAGEEPAAEDGLLGVLAEVWQQVLRVRPAPHDRFFDLGGDSLLASETVTRTLAVLGLDAAHGSGLVRALLAAPTLEGFAAAVREARHGTAGTAAPPADFVKEAELGFDLPPATGPAPRPHDPRHVLLTGASGFVGAFLLDRLLRTTRARVHCPVRATGPAHAERRVRTALARYGLHPDEAAWQRVECFPGDLTQPALGLSDARTADLSRTLDLVVHNGAHVNFLYPYEELRAANVDGTREVVRIAAPRRVPVHFVSTVAVVAGFGAAGVREVDEDLPLDHADALTMGYAESKWVAEGVLRQAADQGLPVAVHRPYEVTGDTARGVCNTETAICSLLKMIADTGLAPDIALPMDFVPVDHLAAALVHIATHQQADGRVYHLTNPRPAMLSDVLDRMRAAGHTLRTLPYDEWVAALVRHVAAHPTAATAPFVSLCVDRGRTTDRSVKEMYLQDTFPVLGRRNTEAALAGSGLDCPPVDAALLDRYLEYFHTSGYLTRPATSPSEGTA
ncbi:amino acid adenylation domain-containing protein [Streptomyces mobaraensis NBRC 13819 = DSM 40847]|uniref:Thioester reductase domain protein n=1 Tax=Streptomyces mobaraensis (strain ATCC 29032 / DSM 40847 / JCM 4168 / NBRC 13819 / NCIMB 11159 / IPCR 16-22) TaxID=1223523 RepID=M3BYU2_STRM1|nr:amino acid adenylation domain-containing protein [Streptomyces mobaraensis]EME96910.1 thioester reductase domain protein [Streptomyces mobaraensis NBRC 13819 = DSM 40847]QTT77440.1 amino acid adenylation domain-containing protein [Streptomyces mobaraensis NBRC 13819 = DSM 40847]